MKTNVSTLFYLKKPRSFTKSVAPVYMRITVEGKRTEITTGLACEPERWNSRAGRAKGTKDEIKSFNAQLDKLKIKVYEAQRSLADEEKEITSETLKNKLVGRGAVSHMLLDVFREHNQIMSVLVGKEYAPGTLERYETTLRHTKEFMQSKYGFSDINIKKVDHAFISNFDFYLRSVRRCGNNSTVKYINKFGKIIRLSLSNGWITANPFTGYKGKLKTLDRTFLSTKELQIIGDKKFASERLTQVRDVFLFCCFTGLAYADVKKLKNSDIRQGLDGCQWIFTKRQKTDTRSAIPLLPMALDIIGRYSQHPLSAKQDMPLPVPSNQKFNEYLKEIAEVCGVDKTLTSHIARHTFATTVTLSNGVPIESVSKMLGHSSLRQTQHYAKTLDLKVSADMLLLKEKLELNLSR